MFCGNCGNKLNENNLCDLCNKTEIDNLKKRKIKLLINTLLYVILAIILIIIIYEKKYGDVNIDRIDAINNTSDNDKIKFTLYDTDYYLNDNMAKFLNNGFTIDIDDIENTSINADSISTYTFYYKNKAVFFGAVYCPQTNSCNLKDTVLIKANFYDDSNVIINDQISYSSKQSDIINILGEKTGVFYQDNTLDVWTSSSSIGSSYYIVRFSKNSYISNNVTEIRIGLWWYDGEAIHTIMEDNNEE